MNEAARVGIQQAIAAFVSMLVCAAVGFAAFCLSDGVLWFLIMLIAEPAVIAVAAGVSAALLRERSVYFIIMGASVLAYIVGIFTIDEVFLPFALFAPAGLAIGGFFGSLFRKGGDMEITLRQAAAADAELLIELYNAAFYDDFVRYGECPAYGRSVEQMARSIERYTKYIIASRDVQIGVISFENTGGGEYYLGCLCVIPSYQGKGVGTLAFKRMLSLCGDWQSVSLVTPADKTENIRFYVEKCGFSVVGRHMDGRVEVAELYLKRQTH